MRGRCGSGWRSGSEFQVSEFQVSEFQVPEFRSFTFRGGVSGSLVAAVGGGVMGFWSGALLSRFSFVVRPAMEKRQRTGAVQRGAEAAGGGRRSEIGRGRAWFVCFRVFVGVLMWFRHGEFLLPGFEFRLPDSVLRLPDLEMPLRGSVFLLCGSVLPLCDPEIPFRDSMSPFGDPVFPLRGS